MPAHPEQFLPLFLAAQPDLRAFIGSMIPDPVAREDVFQEVAVVLWKNFDRYDSERSFGAWARGVAVRKIWEDRRHRARLPECLSLEQIEQLSGAFEPGPTSANWRAREQALARCLQELPAYSSRLLRMRYEENLCMEDIARAYQSGAEALYQTLSRLRRRLRECVTHRLKEFI